MLAAPVPAKFAESTPMLRVSPLPAVMDPPPSSTPSAMPAGTPLSWVQWIAFPALLIVPVAPSSVRVG